MNRKQQQPTTAHSCQSACSLPSSNSSPSSATSPSSTPSIVSSFLPPSSRAPLQYGSDFDPFYGGDLAISPTSPKQPSPYPRPSGGGAGGRGGTHPCRAFDLSRSLCEGFGIAKDPLLVDVFGFDSITPTTVSTTTSTTTNTNGARRPLMRDEEDAAGLQRLDANECRQRETRMTEGYGGRQQPDPEVTSGQAISAIQMWSTNWGSSSTPYSNSIACASDRYFRRRHHLHHHHHHHRNHYHQPQQPPPPHPMSAALVADGGVRECASCGASLSKTVLRRRNSFGHYICCSCESQLRINESLRASTTTTKKTTQTKKSSRRSGLLCANCNSSASTLWRRNNEGETVCNACGLYYKLHGINRPITMRKDGIQTRKRRPKGSKLLLNGGQSSSSSPDQELTTKTTRLQHGSSVTSDKCSNPRISSSSKSCSPRRDDIGVSKREPLSPIHASPTKDPRVPTTFEHLSDSNYNSYGPMLHHPCATAPGCPPPVVSQPEHDLRRSNLFAFYDGQDLAKTTTTTLTNLEVPPKCHQSVPYAHPYNSRNALHQEHEKQLNYGSGAPLQHAAGPLYGVTSVPSAFPVQGGGEHPRSFNSYYNFSNYNCYNFSNFNSCSAAVYQM